MNEPISKGCVTVKKYSADDLERRNSVYRFMSAGGLIGFMDGKLSANGDWNQMILVFKAEEDGRKHEHHLSQSDYDSGKIGEDGVFVFG